ncbi:MAG: flippase-like domain-containing protein [Acidobacteria bacterium]|nr:flippase-like domain-containing protein [Acidobacteriota bacterium]
MGPVSEANRSSGRRTPPWLGTVLVSVFSLGCLLYVYHDFNWREEIPKLAHIHWAWIALAAACDVLVYVSQAWRWNILLRPVARLPLWRSVQAIYIGMFANEVLPLRSGELIRCYLITVWDRIPFPKVLSSALIERLIDGVWLITGFAVTTLFLDLPSEIDAGVWILTALVALIGGLVVFAVLDQRFGRHVTTRHRWAEPLRMIVEGLHEMGRARTFILAVGASTVYLWLQIIPIHAMLEGYGLDLGLGASAVVLVVLRLGTIVPAAPGNVGLFHVCGYLALHKVLGVEAQSAKMVTGVMFFVITVPLLVAGAVAVALTGTEIREIYQRAHSQSRTSPAAPPERPVAD